MYKVNRSWWWQCFLSFMFAFFILAACGRNRDAASTTGGSSTDSSQTANNNAPAAPTMPAGNFTAVGQQSILTDTAALTQTAQTTQTAKAAGGADLERGANSYTKNKCGDCHGAKGEGVEGKGKAIAGTTLTLEKFDEVLRTGGGLGNSHIFGRSAVSPAGMEALYAYVQSLAGK